MNYQPKQNDTTIFNDLAFEPINSLNLTALKFMVDYCISREYDTFILEDSMLWLARANIYQNQIIILQGSGAKQ